MLRGQAPLTAAMLQVSMAETLLRLTAVTPQQRTARLTAATQARPTAVTQVARRTRPTAAADPNQGSLGQAPILR